MTEPSVATATPQPVATATPQPVATATTPSATSTTVPVAEGANVPAATVTADPMRETPGLDPSTFAVANTGANPGTVPAAAPAHTISQSERLELLNNVEMEVTAELGRARMTVRELLTLTPGTVVELDRLAGGPVDLFVNGTLIARGEVVVVDEEFGVRISEIVSVGTEATR